MTSSRWSGVSSDARPQAAVGLSGSGAFVVELLGPAGAGKSTLVRHLQRRANGAIAPLALWGLPRRRLAVHGVQMLPTFLWLARDPRPPAARELMQMIRMETLHEAVEAKRDGPAEYIVLDEGPIFALSWMEVFFPERTGARFAAWRRQTVARWARTLDAIVLLDAPDSVLMQRLRTRRKPHMIKDTPEAETRLFLSRFRTAFGRSLAELDAAEGAPPVIQLIWNDGPSERAAEDLVAALERAIRGR